MALKAKYFFLLIGLSLASKISFAQHAYNYQRKIDSLKVELSKTKIDTAKVNILNQIAITHINADAKKTIQYAKKSIVLATKVKFANGLATANQWMAWGYIFKTDYSNAMTYTQKAIRILKKNKNEKDLPRSYRALGTIYFFHGQLSPNLSDFNLALTYHLKAIKLSKKWKDDNGITAAKTCLGLTYMEIAKINHKKQDFDKALKFVLQALYDKEHLNERAEIPNALANAGEVYLAMGRFYNDTLCSSKAFNFFTKSVSLDPNKNDKRVVLECLNGAGLAALQLNNFRTALIYLNNAFQLALVIGATDELKRTCEGLSTLYEKNHDYQKAFEFMGLFKKYSEEIANEKNSKVIMEFEHNNEKEKQAIEAKAKAKLHAQEIEKQKTITYSIICGLILVFAFSLFVIRSLRLARKQKALIEIQKAEVERSKMLIEQKNEDIIGSIRYAKRIQLALLPSKKYIEKAMNTLRVNYKK